MPEVRRAKFLVVFFCLWMRQDGFFVFDRQEMRDSRWNRLEARLRGFPGIFQRGLKIPVLREQRVDLWCWRGIDADQNVFQPLTVVDAMGFAGCREGKQNRQKGATRPIMPDWDLTAQGVRLFSSRFLHKMQKKGITSTEKDIKSQNSPLVKITFLLYNLRQNNISKERNYHDPQILRFFLGGITAFIPAFSAFSTIASES